MFAGNMNFGKVIDKVAQMVKAKSNTPYAERFPDEEERKRRLKAGDVKAMGLKKGGYVKAADGICKKGKTRGKMV